MAGSADLTSGQPTSGMTVGAAASGPSASFGTSNETSAEVISNIPKASLTVGPFNASWGSDGKGNWAVEGGFSFKVIPKIISFTRPEDVNE